MVEEVEKELIWDILRRNYYQKTVSVTFSIFLDLINKIEDFMRTYNIQSRSMAICYLVHLGFAFDLEKRAEAQAERDAASIVTPDIPLEEEADAVGFHRIKKEKEREI